MINHAQPKFGMQSLLALPLAAIAAVVLFAALKALGSVLKPLAFAWVLMLILAPVVRLATQRLRIPQTLAILLAMALTLLVFFEAGTFLNSLVTSFVPKYPEYLDKLQALLRHFYERLNPHAVAMLKEFDWQSRLSKSVLSLSGLLISASSTTVVVLIITSFMLIEQRDFSLKITEAFDSPERVAGVLGTISSQVSRYLGLQLVISAATGLCVWLALLAIGIDFAATWGVLAFVLNFIPTIGSILASIPPLLIALVQYAPESYWPFFAALLAILAIQTIIGNVISPRLMGNRLNISPVAILVSLLFWNWLWGVPGALLATPVTAAIKIVCDNIAPLRPIGVLLGSGRPLRKAAKEAAETA